MPVTIGSKLGSHEITALLGRGGMGEVYRARDTKLKRDVAIKILPDEFSRDPDRVSRFQREAEVLASLNHPNIAAIYDLQEADGSRFLVLELVEGETLAERIKRGPIPIDEALDIGKYICEALEAAHEKAIVHRDLKPANVKITPDGKVKVLDFGLAKAMEQAPATTLSNSPTLLSVAATNAGVILGTAAYMSPEQARGKTVDKRADIWAFGVVLYEMLTGRPLFHGDDGTDTLAAVLRQEPDWESVPVKVRRLLKSCLQRDPKRRLHDIGDAWQLVDEDVPLDASSAPVVKSTLLWKVLATLFLVAFGIAGWGWWRASRTVELVPHLLVRLDVDLGPDVSLGAQSGAAVILSPAGDRLVYVSQSRLFTRKLDQPRASELAGTEGAFAPFFSPDGQWVAFYAQGKLKKVSVDGGGAMNLCDYAFNPVGGTWGEDGNIIASLNPIGGLSRVSSGGGAPAPLTELAQGESTHRWPQLLPGGKAVLFTSHTSPVAGFDGASIEVMTLADRRRKTLVRGGTFGRYLPGGQIIYVNGGTLFAVSLDPDTLAVRGTPTPVLEQVAYSTQNGSAQLDVAKAGTLVYRSEGGGRGLVTVNWLDGAGQTQPLLAKPGDYGYPRLSRDGQRLALVVTEGSNQDIWIYDSQRDTMTRLTFSGEVKSSPLWSPDGRYILFQAKEGMFWTRTDGAGQPQLLIQIMAREKYLYPSSFTPDGNRVAFYEGASSADVWTAALENQGLGLRTTKPEPFLQTPFDERGPSFSPDGRWLAYTSNESGAYQVYVRAFPDKGGKWQISNSGGQSPVFSPSGRELLFRTDDNRMMAASYTAKDDSFVAEKPRPWSGKQLANVGLARNYDLAPDGKRIAALMPVESPGEQKAQNHVTFLENFSDELRRRVPVGK